ncbi:response regulator [Erythrobacter sp.]|uniref:response regulator n=1 Tax=Erythrobacter sp. TaxID=1042 RepID=UPI002EA28563|nr:response regulator [Erythrobacter sp.]
MSEVKSELALFAGDRRLLIAVIAALGLTALLVFAVSQSVLLALVYLAGTAVMVLAASSAARLGEAPAAELKRSADWSVTVAALEGQDSSVAITDRANRLVCASPLFTRTFGVEAAPPKMAPDTNATDKLARLARNAWRDGEAHGEEPIDGAGAQWSVDVRRAGAGADHLVWRFERVAAGEESPTLEIDLAGPLGAMLSRAGIEAAIAGPDGIIRHVSAGFAERAAGDPKATLAGQEFVSFLRVDERDRILFAREGRAGTPQTLIDVPLGEPPLNTGSASDAQPDPNAGAALMLLVDSGVGIGSGWDGTAHAGVAQLEGLLGQLPLGLAMTDRDGRFLFGNDAFLRAVGREQSKLPAFPTDLVVREDKGPLSDAVRRHGRGPATSGDMAVRLNARPEEPVSIGLAGVRGLGEGAVLLSLVDSAEENQLKRQVAQATKMQAVGQLAGGVAHDFNNVLTAIIGTCDLMLLRHTPGDSDYDDIQQIRANSNRAAALTRQLLAFSRQQTLRPEILQLPDVVSEVSPLIKRLLGEGIDYHVQHDRNLGAVRADPQQLEQVIMNLAVNARDAIHTRQAKAQRRPGDARSGKDRAGRIALRTRSIAADQVVKMGSEILPASDYTVLIVEDDGGGIPPDILPKLFEPFFTTKEQGKGTGLGLSTVYGIVKQSGGFIFADNVTDAAGNVRGAQFSMYLPVHRGEVPQRRKEPKAPQSSSDWPGGGRILLVEDEDMVRAVAERALARAGYEVTACPGGEEGLEAIEAGGGFDLVVSDVVMPGMDGPAMVRAIRREHPAIPVVFMSGYAEEALRKDIDIPRMHFIPKPFSVAAITDKVASVMREAKEGENA